MNARVPGEHFGDASRHLGQAWGASGVVEVCVGRLAPVDQGHDETGAYQLAQRVTAWVGYWPGGPHSTTRHSARFAKPVAPPAVATQTVACGAPASVGGLTRTTLVIPGLALLVNLLI